MNKFWIGSMVGASVSFIAMCSLVGKLNDELIATKKELLRCKTICLLEKLTVNELKEQLERIENQED